MIELIILPRVPKHPAFLSSPSHLDRCASLQSHRAGVKSARSAWRRRLQTSSDTGLLLPLLLLLLGTLSCAGAGSCSEVSKPRGSCRSDACTVRSDSPTWPQRPSRTWRSSASPTQCAGKKQPSEALLFSSFPLRRGSLHCAGRNGTLYTIAQLHKSGPISAELLRDAVTSPSKTAAKLSHVPTPNDQKKKKEEMCR